MNRRALTSFALISLALHGAIVLIVHLLRTDHDPWISFISEYAIGPYAWLARTGAVFAISAVIALTAALVSAGIFAKRSVVFAALCATIVLRVLAWIFPVESVAEAVDGGRLPTFSVAAWVHVISAAISVLTMQIATALIVIHVWRRQGYGALVLALAALWLVATIFFLLTILSQPAVFPAGLYQRVFFVSSWLWLLTICVALLGEWLPGGAPGATEGTVEAAS